ncbi:hypothetical protein GJ744_009880 [Endocarpon pusillum]|uniref:Uncharacterized protein n=1 Tax=Endocarpon pusillum TaxID=364733 RepID=A0A8H7AFG7_9EURO|nr:hypothetical protein GJ744_009880 [Endocarpon pusillum]
MSVDNVNQEILSQPAVECLINSDSNSRILQIIISARAVSHTRNLVISEEEWPVLIHKDILHEDLQAWVDQEAPMKEGTKPVASLKMVVRTMHDVWSEPAS